MKFKDGALHLRCYAVREDDGDWFAICLDLNLCARASSAREVRAELHEIIREYAVDAYVRDRAHFKQLMSRRAPLHFWLEYAVLRVRNFISKHRNGASGSAFQEDVRLAPAT